MLLTFSIFYSYKKSTTTSAGAPDRYLCMPVISNIASQNVLHTVSPMPAFDSDWKNAEDTHYLQTLRHRNHLLPQDNSDILPDKVHISDTLLPNTDDHALSDLDVPNSKVHQCFLLAFPYYRSVNNQIFHNRKFCKWFQP